MTNIVVIVIVLILVCSVAVLLTERSRIEKNEEIVVSEIRNELAIEDDSALPIEILKSYLDQNFKELYVSAEKENLMKKKFANLYEKAKNLQDKANFYRRKGNEHISDFVYQYDSLHYLINKHNQDVINLRLQKNKDFFDNCLQYPLDEQQRRSIVSEENNCLVVSSAGSGKTSSIVGKVKYLIEILKVQPEKILLVSYTNKAAAELTERMKINGLRGYTFHKLAIDLIGKVTGTKPSIFDNTDLLFVRCFRELLSDKSFKKSVLLFFSDYQIPEEEWEVNKKQRQQELSNKKKSEIKALLPDMDGNTIVVRSEQEKKICFALSALGVNFRYEEIYEYQVADELHSQYKPDFSIYYEKNGQAKRIYLEHYAIDEHGLVPAWFAKDRGVSYEEANQRYGDGITWKKATHEKYGTTLITTSSADFSHYNIRKKLKELLENEGVPLNEKSDDELYEMVIPENSQREKMMIRLIATFVTLTKSSCQSFETILAKSQRNKDKRSTHIILNIMLPVHHLYEKKLHESGQIDFTDAIIRATEICRNSHPVDYEHIIVDEFQDISIDRYNFLLSLRSDNPPTKLYCVGDDWQSIYRFSGSDMALFSRFEEFFGPADINKIETTYRFGEPLVGLSSRFIQRNNLQIKKDIHSFTTTGKSELYFQAYEKSTYCSTIGAIVNSIPQDKSIFLLGRYTFDDDYLSDKYESIKDGDRFYYMINGRKIEFLTIHKSKGLEADYVILLQCNKDSRGFPSQVNDDPVLDLVLSRGDEFPYGEERRLFYVAITRAKVKTFVMYDKRFPSIFVDEFLHPQRIKDESDMVAHRNAQKKWTRGQDRLLLQLYKEGKSIRQISNIMGRSYTSIVMRLGKFGVDFSR